MFQRVNVEVSGEAVYKNESESFETKKGGKIKMTRTAINFDWLKWILTEFWPIIRPILAFT
jgi:hypothetical protein